MTRSEAINKVLAALGAGGTVLANGPDPQAVWARQLVDVCIALEFIKVEAEPYRGGAHAQWTAEQVKKYNDLTDGPTISSRKE